MTVVLRRAARLLTLGTAVWLGTLAPLSTAEVRGAETAASQEAPYRSPFAIAVSPDAGRVYVSDRTAGCVGVLDGKARHRLAEIALAGEPCGVCLSPEGDRLYVAERGVGSVAVVDTVSSQVCGRITLPDRYPVAVALAPQSKRLYVACQNGHRVWVVDVSESPGRPLGPIAVVREPSSLAVTPDEGRVVVANLLPDGVPTDRDFAAAVSILDVGLRSQKSVVKLPHGSTAAYGVCLSPDGTWAYVVHGLGRFNMPITQLDRGWVSTYALSILHVPESRHVATLLLDEMTQGAANPFAVVCSADGSRLWISHAGTHEVSLVEIGKVHALLGGNVPDDLAAVKDGGQPNIWVRIQRDPSVVAELANDLTALYVAGAIRRFASGGNGPRGLALAGETGELYLANYYAGTVAVLDSDEGRLLGTIPLAERLRSPEGVRRGEMLFHDANLAFQRWHSCASCHPNQGRVDGLTWDFLRDGMGNGKDTISLVFVDETSPLNRRATRQSARQCARSSVEAGHMIVPSEQDVDDLYAYLKSLRPEPSPWLEADGSLTAAARRGKLVFEGKADCGGCHPLPYFTDHQSHNVGILSPTEPDGLYDTPTLTETYRTAPYLHDGRARTIRDVLTIHNEKDEHGITSQLTEQEIDDLETYILSL